MKFTYQMYSMIQSKDFRLGSSRKKMESTLSSPLVKSFLAGSFSGTCSTVIFQPLDLVKTRLQTPTIGGVKNGQNGMLVTLYNVMRNEKVSGLWKGLSPSITRTVPGVGLYFSCLHWLKTNVGSSNPSSLELLALGACARSIAGVTLLPITVIKTRFESGRFSYHGVLAALANIYKTEGVRGLYCGLSATLVRDAPFSGLYFMFYTQTKNFVLQDMVLDRYKPLIHFSCGIVAGCLASVATQPADVVKTHMQLFPQDFNSIRCCIGFIYKEHGFFGFFRGLVPRTLRRTLMAAMAWTVYEQIMTKFGLK